jgi:Uma2 family endonuclease
MTTAPEPMTADDPTRLPRGRARHELVRGELRTMSLFEIPEALAVSKLAHSLHNFACDRHLGSVLPSVGYRLETDPDTVRGPAVSFITRERVEAIGRIPGYWLEAPALAVEVYAPSDIYSHVAERVADYLEHGTPSSGCWTPGVTSSPPIAPASACRCTPATPCSTPKGSFLAGSCRWASYSPCRGIKIVAEFDP